MDWMEQEQERGITITSAATPVSGAITASTSSTRRATSTSRPKSSAPCASSTRRRRVRSVAASSRAVRNRLAAADKYRVPAHLLRQQDGPHRRGLQRTFDRFISKLEANPVAIQLPIGSERQVRRIVDLIKMKSITYKDETMGADYIIGDIPANMLDEAKHYREQLIEKVSEVDDTISRSTCTARAKTITEDEIKAALRKRVNSSVRGKNEAAFVPVICGFGLQDKGVQPLLDAVVDSCRRGSTAGDHRASIRTRKVDPGAPRSQLDPASRVRRCAFSALAFKIMTDPFVVSSPSSRSIPVCSAPGRRSTTRPSSARSASAAS